MTDEKSPHELMKEYDKLAEEESQYRWEKNEALDEVSERLERAVEDALRDVPPKAEVFRVNESGEKHSIRLRFDRGEVVKQVTEHLPDTFVVDEIETDGTITAEWIEGDRDEAHVLRATLLGIIAEGTTESEFEPSDLYWDDVVDQAVSLGFEEQDVERQLHRFDEYGTIEVDEEHNESAITRGRYFNSR